jgi:hypothetical protein
MVGDDGEFDVSHGESSHWRKSVDLSFGLIEIVVGYSWYYFGSARLDRPRTVTVSAESAND